MVRNISKEIIFKSIFQVIFEETNSTVMIHKSDFSADLQHFSTFSLSHGTIYTTEFCSGVTVCS